MSKETSSSPPPTSLETNTSIEDDNNSEEIINWVKEASAIIRDVKTHVAGIHISKKLPSNESNIYINIRTFEGSTFCVHVSSMGFRIVSELFDTIDSDKAEISEAEEVFETPYALLNKVSQRYVESFGNQLCKQLLHLQQMRTEFNEEDEEDLDRENIKSFV